jgi:Flp pilus assembly protein TadD
MKKICTLILLAAMLVAVSGCKTHSGSREFIPGKGWVPND